MSNADAHSSDVIMFEPDTIIVRATDLDIAEIWITHYADTCRFDTSTGEWVAYDRGVWHRLNGDAVPGNKFSELRKNLVPVKENNGKEVDMTEWLNQGSRASSVLRNVSLDTRVQIDGDNFDRHPDLFNLENGTLNLRSGRFMGHNPGHLLTQQAPVRYDPEAPAREFERFIVEVLPDKQVREYVRRMFGMALLGDVEEHILPVFIGEGRNGKGVLLRIMQALFGNYATGLQKKVLLESKFEEHSTVLMTLKGKRLAVAQELDRSARWDTAMVKSLTGGDAITARRMRQDDETFNPSHTLVMASNHRPNIGDGESAFWARYREIPFLVTFTSPDLTLADRIIGNEMPGVLNWVLAGLRQYVTDGRLVTPDAVRIASTEAREEGDPLVTFVNDTYRVTGNESDQVYVKAVFDAYQDWRRGNPQAPQLTNRTIRKRLISAYNTTGSVTLSERKDKTGALIAGMCDPAVGDDNRAGDDVVTMSRSPYNALTCDDDDDDDNDDNTGHSMRYGEEVSTTLVTPSAGYYYKTSSPSSPDPVSAGQRLTSSSPGEAIIVTSPPGHEEVTGAGDSSEGYTGSTVTTGLLSDGSVNPEYRIGAGGAERGTEVVSYGEWVARMKRAGKWVDPEPGFTWYSLSDSEGASSVSDESV